MSVEPYVLRADGKVHESDVRYVTVFHNTAWSEHPEQEQSYIASASRDLTARLIPFPFYGSDQLTQKEDEHEEEGTEGENDPNDEVGCGKVFLGHTAFVNFVLIHPNLALDKLLPQHHHQHHQNNSNNDDELHESTTSSTLTPPHLSVITGSNDNHVAIWNAETMSLEAVLDGHASGVCCGVIVSETNHHHKKQKDEEEEEEKEKEEESEKKNQLKHKTYSLAKDDDDDCAGNSSVLVTGD